MTAAQQDREKEGAEAEQRMNARLGAIEEQGRRTLELVRALVGLLLPKEGKTGPSLEDLLSALLAQQGDMVVLLRAIQAEQLRQGQEIPPAAAEAVLDTLRKPGQRTRA